MKKLDKVKWGIIGCGDVTEVKSGPAFAMIENSELIAVFRRNEDKAKDYARRHNVKKWYSDIERLLNDNEINSVYIATPPSSHSKYAIMAAKAGKNIYVEKPMALNYSEAFEMINAAEKNSVSLFIAYYRRALPYFKKVKELLETGIIGKPNTVSLKLYKPLPKLKKENLPWRFKREIAGGGLFVDLGCHQLDILDYFFGRIISVKGIVDKRNGIYDVEDLVSAVFQFDSGVIGNGLWDFSSYKSEDSIEIIGSGGIMSFSTFTFDPIRIITEDKTEIYEFERTEPIQKPMIEAVVGELIGEGHSPSSVKSAANTSKIIDEILKDYYTKKQSKTEAK